VPKGESLLPHALDSSGVFTHREKEEVREQVARIIASSAFRSSKRYTDFLRYTVEHTLDGDAERIKERILGVEVFGRVPNYDTSSDPVVRTSAVEVRKRLQHYYRLHGDSGEIRIDFPRGTYVPEFVWPQAAVALDPNDVGPNLTVKHHRAKWAIPTLAATGLAVLVVLAWTTSPRRETALDHFWNPVMFSQHPVLLCIPDRYSSARNQNATSAIGPYEGSGLTSAANDRTQLFEQRNHVFFVDTFVVAKIAAALGKQGRAFRLVHTEDVTLDDLEQGPAVLIGGANNPWIAQISSSLRFGLAKEGPVAYISDQQNSSSRHWAVTNDPSEVDYAVISRVTKNIAGQPIIIVAGLHSMGTEAAGECLSDPDCFAKAERLAPGDWKSANLQFVLEAKTVNEVAGQPRVIAAYISP
jgi:hypothetical protein